ncbi:hypothetical protein ACFQS1_22315 [Paractinoplanes rhizophilus]|uniref:Type VII secretion system (Wss) protein ESAT-6 n=1 Tax=Paractinoplanes rhizophilus TaxID=1416877 RepID=A0ABW2HW54_9ACTN
MTRDDPGRRISDAGRMLGAERESAGAAVAAASAARPWGDDEAGRAFDGRYRTMASQILTAWEQLARYVEGLGEAASRSIKDDAR